MTDITFAFRGLNNGGGLTWVISLASYLQSQGVTVRVQGPKLFPTAIATLTAAGIPFEIGVIKDTRIVIDSSGCKVAREHDGPVIAVRHSRRTWLSGWVKATKKADEIVAVSIPVAHNTRRYTGRMPVVINNGVDIDRLDKVGVDLRKKFGREFLMGFVGRNSQLKNAAQIAKAAKLFNRHAIFAGGNIAGDSRLKNDYTQLIGYTTTIGDVYRAADVMCVPSKHEAFPFSVVEALCLGKRVVVSARAHCEEYADMVTRIEVQHARTTPTAEAIVAHVKKALAGPPPDVAVARERFGLPLFYKKWMQLLEKYL